MLIATGGDVLERRGLDGLLSRAGTLRLPIALAPSVTPLLTEERAAALHRAGVRVASISLDGAAARRTSGSAASRATTQRRSRRSACSGATGSQFR